MFRKYYCIKQYDITDCGAACLATISKQHGFRISITKQIINWFKGSIENY